MTTNDATKKRFSLPALLLCCFAAAFLLMNLTFLTRGVSLFGGEKSILISDMQQQYIHFFAALRNGDFTYTTALGLSGDFMGTFAYYLSSPLSLLIFLFQKEQLQTALLLILYLKVSLAAASFGFMLSRLFRRTDWTLVVFSLCYALMSFVFYFFINIFWLDALVLLPVLALLLNQLAETGRARWLPPALGLLFLANFYISYITGLFLLLLFVFLTVQKRLALRDALLRGLRLAGSAVLGAGMAAVVLLPAVRSYMKAMGAEKVSYYDGLNFTPKQFIRKLFVGFFDSIGNYAAPTIFCGVLIFVLLVCYFFNRGIARRERVAAAGLLLFMFASFLLPALDIAWHAFSYPNSFAYRYAFCFSFFMILLAARAFYKLKDTPNFALLLCFLPAVLMAVFSGWLLDNIPATAFAATAGAFVLYPALLLIFKNANFKGLSSLVPALLVLLVVAELSLNGTLILRRLNEGDPFPAAADWTGEIAEKTALLDAQPDAVEFRVAAVGDRAYNTVASLGYHGVSIFSSDYDPALQETFRSFGYQGAYKSCWYLAGSPISDSLLGVRYVLSDQPVNGYPAVAEGESCALYLNENALPPAYCVSPDIIGFAFGDNAIDNQNTLLDAMQLQPGENGDGEKLGALAEHALENIHWDGRRLSGTIDAPGDCLLLVTFPYDKNYAVKIDGAKAEPFEVLGRLTAVEISAGRHTVEVVYRPVQVYIGGGISLLSLGGWILFVALRRKEPMDIRG